MAKTMLMLLMFLIYWTTLQKERSYKDFGGWYFCDYAFCISFNEM